MGRRLLKKQGRLGMSFMDLHNATDQDDIEDLSASISSNRLTSPKSLLDLASNPDATEKKNKKTYDSACAAAGQVCNMNSNLDHCLNINNFLNDQFSLR